MTDLSDSYSPQWLYLDEFARALRPEVELTDDYSTFEPTPDTEDAAEVKAAIALLVRDRIITNGKLNEAEFRFLEGKPDLSTTFWVNQLTPEDFSWRHSHLIAGVDNTKHKGRLHDHIGLLIEIAASALQYFGEPAAKPRRNSPEQTRALTVLREIYGDTFPTRGKVTDKDLVRAVNAKLDKSERALEKDTVLRAAGRRRK